MAKITTKSVKKLIERIWVIFIVPIGCFAGMIKLGLAPEGAGIILTYIGGLHLVGRKTETMNEPSIPSPASD